MYEKISPETDQEIAALLRANRKCMGMTQQQAANKAGLRLRHYTKFECCERSLLAASFNTTMSVLEALGIDPDDFVKKYVMDTWPPQEMV